MGFLIKIESVMKKTIGVIILLILPFVSMSQRHGNISGTVKDSKTGELIPGVNVIVEQLVKGASTDVNGHFKIPDLPYGVYDLSVSCIGYQSKKKRVRVNKSKMMLVDFSIDRHSEKLNEVLVAGKSDIQKRREAPEAVTVIDASQLRGQAVSLENVLNKAVGMKVRQTGGLGSTSRMMIHGLEGKRVQIFLNGDPLNSPDGSITIDDIPIDLIERIDIYKGVIPARFGGDGLGGAVDITTREFDTDYIDLAYEHSSYNTNRATWILKKNLKESGILFGFGGFFNYAENDYSFKSPYQDNLTIKRDHDAFKSYILSGSATFTKLWFDKIDAEFNYYINEKEIQGIKKNIQHAERKSDLMAFEFGLEKEEFFIDQLSFDYDLLVGSVRAHLIDTSSFNYDFRGNRFSSPNGKGEIGWTPNDSDDKTFEFRQRLNLNYKINANHDINLNTSSRYAKKRPQDLLASEHADYNLSGYPSELTSMVSGLTHEWKPNGERFINMLSAKLYHINSSISDINMFTIQDKPLIKSNSTTGYGFGNAIRWSPYSFFNIKASYQHALRLPIGDELFGDGMLIGPSSELKPERSDNINLGIMFDSFDFIGFHRLQFELSGFFMNVKDMIRLMQSNMNYSYVNLGEVEIKGIEAELKADITKGIYAYANMTYQDVRDVMKYEPGSLAPNVTKDLRLPNIPYLFGNFGLEYHKEDLFGKNQFFKVFWDAQYTEEFFFNWNVSEKQNRKIPTSIVQNIGVQQVFGKNKYSISAEVHNLFDREVWNMYKMPLMGRSLHFKLRYTFMKDL